MSINFPSRIVKSIFITFSTLGLIIGSTAVVSALTATTTISSAISAVISLSTNGTVNVNVVPTGAGAQTIASDTATVSTNDSSGYTLQLGETGAGTTLVSGSNTIPASSGSQTTPVVMAANTWGYRVDSLGGFGSGPTSAVSSVAISGSLKFAAVAASGSPNTPNAARKSSWSQRTIRTAARSRYSP